MKNQKIKNCLLTAHVSSEDISLLKQTRYLDSGIQLIYSYSEKDFNNINWQIKFIEIGKRESDYVKEIYYISQGEIFCKKDNNIELVNTSLTTFLFFEEQLYNFYTKIYNVSTKENIINTIIKFLMMEKKLFLADGKAYFSDHYYVEKITDYGELESLFFLQEDWKNLLSNNYIHLFVVFQILNKFSSMVKQAQAIQDMQITNDIIIKNPTIDFISFSKLLKEEMIFKYENYSLQKSNLSKLRKLGFLK